MRIGELAQRTGVEVDTIRYYENPDYCRHHLGRAMVTGNMASNTLSDWPSSATAEPWICR